MKWIATVALSIFYSIYTGLDRYGLVSSIYCRAPEYANES